MSDKPKLKLIVHDGHAYCTSLDIAQHFHKRHDNVVEAIRRKITQCSSEFSLLNFKESTRQNSRGKSIPIFELTRDGFAIVAMGFTGPEATRWQEAYIAAFNAMERELSQRGAINRVAEQLKFTFPDLSAELDQPRRKAIRADAAAMAIETRQLVVPTPKAADLIRLVKRGALEGYRDPQSGRWFVYADSLEAYLRRARLVAA